MSEEEEMLEAQETQHPCDACQRPVGIMALVSESDIVPTDGSPRGGLCAACDRDRQETGAATYLCRTCHQPVEEVGDAHCNRGACLNYRGLL